MIMIDREVSLIAVGVIRYVNSTDSARAVLLMEFLFVPFLSHPVPSEALVLNLTVPTLELQAVVRLRLLIKFGTWFMLSTRAASLVVAAHFGPLGPTPFRDSRYTFLISIMRLGSGLPM